MGILSCLNLGGAVGGNGLVGKLDVLLLGLLLGLALLLVPSLPLLAGLDLDSPGLSDVDVTLQDRKKKKATRCR